MPPSTTLAVTAQRGTQEAGDGNAEVNPKKVDGNRMPLANMRSFHPSRCVPHCRPAIPNAQAAAQATNDANQR